ncbi:MAG: Dabb family protein [Treponemataceae bacterium]|nr:MAG: Dabb family protein [Treponemataceae bacterium]
MIRHLVLWTLNEEAKNEGVEKVAGILDASARNMVGKIPGLLKSEVRVNEQAGPHEVVLYSEFARKEDISLYLDHPVHQTHRKLVHTYISGREAVDIEAD